MNATQTQPMNKKTQPFNSKPLNAFERAEADFGHQPEFEQGAQLLEGVLKATTRDQFAQVVAAQAKALAVPMNDMLAAALTIKGTATVLTKRETMRTINRLGKRTDATKVEDINQILLQVNEGYPTMHSKVRGLLDKVGFFTFVQEGKELLGMEAGVVTLGKTQVRQARRGTWKERA